MAISPPAERRKFITGSRYVFCGKAARLPVQVQLPVSVRPQGPLRVQRVRVIFLLDLLERHLCAIWGPLQAVRCGQKPHGRHWVIKQVRDSLPARCCFAEPLIEGVMNLEDTVRLIGGVPGGIPLDCQLSVLGQ